MQDLEGKITGETPEAEAVPEAPSSTPEAQEERAPDSLPQSETGPPDAVETEPSPDDSDASTAAQVAAGEPIAAEQLLIGQPQPVGGDEAAKAELKAIIEAVIYVASEPLTVQQIAQALNRTREDVEAAIAAIVADCDRPERGLFVREIAGGYQMATKPEHHEAIRAFVRNLKQPLKLSQAALETLAVIAYKQPITLPEILEIRGVQGGSVLKTLLDRKLITTAGRKNVVGKPILYKTTKDFLTQFGLKDVAELPSLKEFEEIRRQSLADDELAPPEAPAVPQQPAVEAPSPAAAAEETQQPATGAPEPQPQAEDQSANQETSDA